MWVVRQALHRSGIEKKKNNQRYGIVQGHPWCSSSKPIARNHIQVPLRPSFCFKTPVSKCHAISEKTGDLTYGLQRLSRKTFCAGYGWDQKSNSRGAHGVPNPVGLTQYLHISLLLALLSTSRRFSGRPHLCAVNEVSATLLKRLQAK